MPSFKRIAVTTVGAVVGYQLTNIVISPMLKILPNEDGSVGTFEFLEAAVITATVLAANMLV